MKDIYVRLHWYINYNLLLEHTKNYRTVDMLSTAQKKIFSE